MKNKGSLTPQQIHKADKDNKQYKRFIKDRENEKLTKLCPNLYFLCSDILKEKWSVLYNRGCQKVLCDVEDMLIMIIQADNRNRLTKYRSTLESEEEIFVCDWYMGKLIKGNYIESVYQMKMYYFVREWKAKRLEEWQKVKPKRVDTSISIREKCKQKNVKYTTVIGYRFDHPELTEDEAIEFVYNNSNKFNCYTYCKENNLNYRNFLYYRKSHPELSLEEIKDYYRKKNSKK